MKIKLACFFFIFPVLELYAQDSSEKYPVLNTFLGTRLVNGQSSELPGIGELTLMINHRFGELKGGAYEFWGLDQAEIRIGFDYALTDYLALGFGRNSYQKTYDFSAKFKALQQRENGMPVTVTGFVSSYANTLRNVYPASDNNLSDRMSYLSQLMVAHKFSSTASLIISSGWIYEKYSLLSSESYSSLNMGVGGRLKVLPRVHLNAEYYYVFQRQLNTYHPFSLGVDLDTGGHLFQLMVSNTQTTFEKSLLTDTNGQWSKGELYFGFNLIRVFYLK